MSTTVLAIHISHWIAAVLLFGIAIYCLNFRKKAVVLALSVFCGLSGLWALCAALIFAEIEMPNMILLNRMKLIAPALLPLSILALAMTLRYQRSWYKYLYMLLAVIPLISVMILGSPYHHELFVTNYHSIFVGGYELLAYSNGPWFFYHNLNARMIVAATILVLILAANDFSRTQRPRIWLVILAILIPFIGDTIAVHGPSYLRFLQISPTLLLVSAVLIIYAIIFRHFVDVVPFARRHILDSLGDMYLIFDEDQVLVDFNTKAQEHLQINRSDLGQSSATLVRRHPLIRDILGFQGSVPSELTFNDETYELTTHVLLNDLQEKAGTVVACKNISLRKQAEKTLQDLNDVKTKLLAIVGHDFQGNLAASLVIAQNLGRNVSAVKPEDISQAAANLEKTATNNIALTNELLNWSKHDLGADTTAELIDLEKIVEETRDFLSPVLDESLVTLEMSLDCKAVRTDTSSFKIILRNLLSNAIKASPKHGKVVLNIRTDANDISFTVKDDGPGIDEKFHANLFEFKKDKNAGIGLFLCQEFVRRLNGKIWVESERSAGSRFCVTIPLN